jgi:hypothetical protein
MPYLACQYISSWGMGVYGRLIYVNNMLQMMIHLKQLDTFAIQFDSYEKELFLIDSDPLTHDGRGAGSARHLAWRLGFGCQEDTLGVACGRE